jgi:hypothetical protein
VPACGTGGQCRVFLSSVLYPGDLGGLTGADAKCQGLAGAAGLPGTYKAWLSDSTSSVISRFVPSSGPYQLVNGITIAANWADLKDGLLAAPINVTETGGGPGGSTTAWTHTAFDGSPALGDAHCQDWGSTVAPSGTAGNVTATDPTWALFNSTTCNTPLHLYCFQQTGAS